jgi:hypothetical protein
MKAAVATGVSYGLGVLTLAYCIAFTPPLWVAMVFSSGTYVTARLAVHLLLRA